MVPRRPMSGLILLIISRVPIRLSRKGSSSMAVFWIARRILFSSWLWLRRAVLTIWAMGLFVSSQTVRASTRRRLRRRFFMPVMKLWQLMLPLCK